MDNNPMREMVASMFENMEYTELSTARVYHKVYTDLGEMQFDIASRSTEYKNPLPGVLPDVAMNVNVEDAKHLIGILQLFIAEVE